MGIERVLLNNYLYWNLISSGISSLVYRYFSYRVTSLSFSLLFSPCSLGLNQTEYCGINSKHSEQLLTY